MDEKYAEICTAGNLEADFQQFPFVQDGKFHNIVVKHQ